MHKRKLVLALVAMLALAAVVVGCGGGGSSSSGSTTSTDAGSSGSGGEAPTKAVFVKEADKVCGEAEDELTKEVEAFAKENGIEGEPSNEQQAEIFQTMVLPNIAKQGEELAALTPPEGDEETIEDLTDTLAEEVAEAEEETGVPADNTLAGATKQAREYGFRVCGS